jgi:hypothetical protein
MAEFPMTSSREYDEPFHDLSVDAVFTAPDGSERKVPAFWAGDDVWNVRYAYPIVGRHHYRTICSDADDSGLHGQEGDVEIRPYEGDNPLLQHGPLRVSESRRHLEHQDGTPFFWLGDTWWHGLAARLGWPEDFRVLAADRVSKGFSVIQIVAGLLPELVEDRFWSKWSRNEAGWAWEPGFSRINPHFFDAADLRIGHLVQSGLVPCLVGAWGYYAKYAGTENMKKHWRYLVARYGAYPVIWCVAGEMTMPPYDDWNEEYRKELHDSWSEVDGYLREIDPYKHPITMHRNSFRWVEPRSLVDIDMLQTGHTYTVMEKAVRGVLERVAKEPRYPVLIGEVCYEGEYGANWQDVQRFFFWASMLSGSCGHTYGASGLWQFFTETDKFVGMAEYSEQTWVEAMNLPGSRQLGISKALLERYQWWEFEPRQEPDWDKPDPTNPYPWWLPFPDEAGRVSPFAAGIPGQVWVIYLCGDAFESSLWGLKGRSITIEPDASYRAFFFNPRNGQEIALGHVEPNESGRWAIPEKRTREDMVLVLEGAGPSK